MYKVELSIKAGNYHLPDRRPSGPLIGREDAVNIMKRYIKESMQNEGKVDGKFQLLGTSGMKGIGKSALLLHGVDVVVPQAVTELAEERVRQGPALAAQAVYLTFNGGTGMTDVSERPSGQQAPPATTISRTHWECVAGLPRSRHESGAEVRFCGIAEAVQEDLANV